MGKAGNIQRQTRTQRIKIAMRGNNIEFMSRYDIKQFVKNNEITDDIAIISINDSKSELIEMQEVLGKFNTLFVSFSDVDFKNNAGSMTHADAEEIFRFIEANSDKQFIVHCFMGVSRSGAVAKFINEHLERDISHLSHYMGYNRYVLDMMCRAAGKSNAAMYEAMEKEQ